MTELKPCPFCGGEAEMLTAESMHGGYLFGIMCNDCRSRGDIYDNEAEAIAAWNSRADYHGYEQAAIEAWENIKAWNSRAELRSEPLSMRTFDSMETALSIAEKEVEIEELRRENYELCKENEELAHRRAELESTAHGTLTAEQVREVLLCHLPHREYYSVEQTDVWQVIADELNSRAERTCRDTDENEWHFVCSACGYEQNGYETWNYCPNCGARVEVGE